MFTVLFTLVGILVFIFSCFTVKYKKAFVRLLMMAGAGLVLDVLIFVTFAICALV